MPTFNRLSWHSPQNSSKWLPVYFLTGFKTCFFFFKPAFLFLKLHMLLSWNCSASFKVCKAPWKITEMKSTKICKLLLLFLSASSHRIWSFQRQSKISFMSTVIIFYCILWESNMLSNICELQNFPRTWEQIFHVA